MNRDEIARHVGRKVRITTVREGVLKRWPNGELFLVSKGLNNSSEELDARVPVRCGFVTSVEPVTPLGWPPQRGDVWKSVRPDVSYIAGPSPEEGAWVLVPDDLNTVEVVRGDENGAFSARENALISNLHLMYRRKDS